MACLTRGSAMSDVHPSAGETPPPGRVEREFTVRERGQFEQAARKFLRHKAAVVSLTVFVLIVILAFGGPLVWKYRITDYTTDYSHPPSLSHPFGTDTQGRDWFAFVLRGLQ